VVNLDFSNESYNLFFLEHISKIWNIVLNIYYEKKKISMLEAIKSLSPKQRLAALLAIALVSAATSLGTAYMKGSDCGEVSEKYRGCVENFNRLVEMSDDTQKKYLKARQDMLEISERLDRLEEAMGKKQRTLESCAPARPEKMLDSIRAISEKYEKK